MVQKMIKLYYTVEKQLDDIDGIGTINGLRDIYLYKIENNIPKLLGEIPSYTDIMSSEEEISDFIDEFVPELNSNNIELIKL